MITFRSFIQRKSRPVVSALGSLLTFRNVVLPLLFGTIMVCTEVAHVHAGPKDGNVVAGDANIVQLNPKLLEIIQGSDKVIIDWRSFSIDWDELVRFLQPDSDSIALNRVNGDTPSYILGQLTADGRVMLINPNGVLFGDSAVVDIGSLVATTIDIRNEDFMAGDYNFDVERASGGTVVNRGRITAAEGGIVALVAPGVENSGVIVARLGRVALASGNSFALDFYGDRLIQIGVDDSVAERLLAPDGTELKALVDNSGEIYADGGTVMLMASSVAKDVVDYAINMEGIIKARTATERNGQIVLEGAGEGIVRVTGTLDASGRESGDTGGNVKILGSKVGLVRSAEVDASGDAGGGEVLIGGNFQGRGPERNAEFTTIGREVAIQADALTTGDGGRVIVWSDRVTRFYGNISARGGSVSGDGGFAEISGKQHLQFAPNSIDLSAPNGLIGELLLDPLDIVISDGDGSDDSAVSMDNVIYFNDDSTATYNITPAAFEAIDADITLQALRDITVSSPIERTGSGDSTLSLQAGRDLIIDANITGSSGAHSFLFEADSPRSSNNDGIGELKIASGVTITSNNGDITLIGAGFEIDTSSSIDAGTGDIHIAPSRAVAMMISTAASDLSNTNLSNAEIGTFTTSGTIYIGTATTGPDGSGGAGSSISASGITVSEDLTISGSASLVLDSGGTTTLSADVSTDDGAITFIGAVDLVGDVTVNSGATGGTITFTSTVDGGHALTLDADGGDVNLFSALGGSTALESLTVIGGQVNVNTVATNGNINIEGSTGIALNGATYASDNGDITLGGAGGVTISGSLDSTVSLQAGGDLTINTNITGRNGAHSLIFEADSPGLSSNDGDGTLTIASGVTITSNNGDITLIGAGFEIDATSSINAGTGDIHVAPSRAVAMTISAAVANLSNAEIGTFTTSGTIYIGTATTGPSGSGGAGSTISSSGITVSEDLTISGSASLVLRTGGDITVSSAIDVSGSADSILSLQAGRHLTINADITGSNGAHSLIFEADSPGLSSNDGTGTLTIAAGVTITSNNGDITLIGAEFEIDTASSINPSSSTNAGTGDIHVAPSRDFALSQPIAMTISNAATGNLSNAEIGTFTTSGTIYIGTATTGPDGSGGAGSSISASGITVSEDLTISGSASLVLDSGGTTTLNNDVTTQGGAITFEDGVILGANVTVNSGATGGAITFTSTVDGDGELTVNAGSGTVAFQGAVGGTTATTALRSLSVTGGTITLSADVSTNDGAITFTGAVELAGDVTVDSDADDDATDGNITFTSTVVSAAGGNRTLTLDAGGGTVKLQGVVGGTTATTALRSLAVTGGLITLSANVSTDDGAITFTGAVELAGDVTVDSDADDDATDGNITFTSTVVSAAGGNRTLTLDAGGGDVDLRGAVGGTTATTALRSLAVTGGLITLSANVSTDDGAITFTGAVELAGDVTVDSDADDDGTAGNIMFTSTVDGDGSRELTLDAGGGTVDLQGAVGGTTKLASLTVTGGQVNVDTVATTGNIDIEGSTGIALNGATYASDNGDITFGGAGDVTISGSSDSTVSLQAGGNLTINTNITGSNGAHSLIFEADSPGLSSNDGNGTLKIASGVTITSNNGDITLIGAGFEIDATSSINAGTGDIHVAPSRTVAMTISAAAANLSNAEIDTFTTSGTIYIGTATTGPSGSGGAGSSISASSITVSEDLTISGSASLVLRTGGDITVSNSIVKSGSSDSTLALQAGGDLTINADITGSSGVHSLIFEADSPGSSNNDGTGKLTIASGITITSNNGDITLIGATFDINATSSIDAGTGDIHVAPSQAVAMTISTTANLSLAEIGRFTTSGTIHIGTATTGPTGTGGAGSSISATSITVSQDLTISGSASLVLDSSGATTLSAEVSTENGNITFEDAVTLSADVSTEDGDITFADAVTLGADVTVDSDADDDGTGGAITFESTVDGAQALTVNAGSGTVAFQGAVGGTTATTALSGLAVTGGTITLSANVSIDDGIITFSGPVDLLADVTVTSDADDDGTGGAITFESTVDGAQALTVNAGSGTVAFQGAVGGTTATTALSGLAVTGGTITLSANVSIDDGIITFSGPVDLLADVTVTSDADDDGTGGAITFESTVDGAQALTLDAGGGAVDLQGAVGGTTKLASLTVDGGQVNLYTVATTGDIDIEGSMGIALNGATYASDDGDIILGGAGGVTISDSSDSTVSLQAGDDLTINTDITGSNGAHSLIFEADSPGLSSNDGNGTLMIASGVIITSNNGDITLIGAGFEIDTSSSIDAGTGDIHVAPSRAVAMTISNAAMANLSDAEIGRFTTSGTIHIGTATTGPSGSGGAGSSISASGITVSEDLTISGSASLVLDSGGTTTLNNDVSTEDGDITFADAVTLGADVTVDSDADDDGTGGAITFESTVDGAQALTVNAGSGTVAFQGAVGGTTATTALSGLAVTGGTITLSANVSIDDGIITFSGPVDLLADVTVTSDADDDGTGGAITFESTVDGAQALTVNAGSGTVAFQGAVGGTTATTALSGLAVTGGTITLSANVSIDDGIITFSGPVDLLADVTVTSDADNDGTGGAITFESTVDGAQALTLDAGGGAVDLQGAVGGTTKLASLTVDGGQVNLYTVATTGDIDIEGSMGIALNGATYASDDGDIILGGAGGVTISDSSDSTVSLQAGDDLTINTDITGSNGAHSLIFEADSPGLSSNDGNGTLMIASGVIITSNNGDITLIGAGFEIDTSSSINAGTGDIHVAPSRAVAMTISNAAMANLSDAEIGRFTTSGTIHIGTATTGPSGSGGAGSSISASGITVSEDLTISGSASLVLDSGGTTTLNNDVSTENGNITFADAVTLGADVTVDSDADDDGTGGAITFESTVDGAQALTVNAGSGTVAFQGAVGGTTATTALSGLAVTGGTITLSANVSIDDGIITFSGPVDLLADVTVTSDADDDGTGGAITFESTVDGAQALTVNAGSGTVAFQGAVGGTTATTALSGLAVTGGTITLSANVSIDDGIITFSGPVDLLADVTVTSDADNDGTGGAITFESTVDGAQALTLDAGGGAVDLQGAVGGTTKLASLTVDGGQVNLYTVATTGDIDIEGSMGIALNGATYASDDGDIILGGAGGVTISDSSDSTVSLQAGDDLTINTDITGSNGAHSLIFEADSPGLSSNDGNGTLTIASGVIITSNNGDITLIGAGFEIDTSSSIDAGTGDIHVAPSRAVAMTISNAAMANLSDAEIGRFTTSGTIHIGTATTGPSGSGGAGSSISASGITVSEDLTISGSASLVLDSSGTTTLNNDVSTENGNITFEDAVTLSADVSTEDGDITFADAVTLGADVTVDSDADNDGTGGAITFESTVDGAQALTVNAGSGTVAFQGAVGGTTATTALSGLAVTGGTITLSANVSIDDGIITFSGPVDLLADVTVTSDADDDGTGGAITFESTVDGAQALTLDAGGGAVDLQGAVGGTTKLASLTVDGGQVNLYTVATTGDIDIEGSMGIALNGATYASDDGDIILGGAGGVTISDSSDSTVSLQAGDDLTINTDITGSNGAHSLIFEADSPGLSSNDGNGTLTIASGVIITSNNGDITLIGATFDINATSSIDAGTGDIHVAPSRAVAMTISNAAMANLSDAEIGRFTTSGTIHIGTATTGPSGSGGAGSSISASGITVSEDLTISGSASLVLDSSGTTTLNNDVSTEDGNITFEDAVTLGADVTVDSDADDDGTGGAITFESTVDGAQALTVNAGSGTVAFQGAVGGTTATTALSGLAVTGGTITLSANVSIDDGIITFSGPVDLLADVTVTSDADNDGTGGAITFESTVDGSHELTVNAGSGTVAFQGAVGGTTATTALSGLAVTGGTITLSASVSIDDGIITFSGPVDLLADVTVTSDADDDGTGGAITFESTVDGAQALTLDAGGGAVDLQGAVGGTTKLASLTVDGGQVNLYTVATTGDIDIEGSMGIALNGATYASDNGDIILGGAGGVTISDSSDSTVSLQAGDDLTINTDITGSNGAHSLIFEADSPGLSSNDGNGTLTIASGVIITSNNGDITLIGAGFEIDTSSSIDAGTGDIHVAPSRAVAMTISNAAMANLSDAEIGRFTTSGTIHIGTATTGPSGSGGAGSSISASGITVSEDLTISGSASLVLDSGGTTTLNNDVSTENGNITFADAVTLGADVTVDSDADDDGTGGAITFESTVDGAQALTVNAGSGTVAFQGAVGGTTATTALSGLAVTGGTITLSANVSIDDGIITFSGPVDLLADVTVTSDADDDGTGGAITFESTVDGAQALTVNAGSGTVAFQGAVGGTTATTALSGLAVTGGTITLSANVSIDDGIITFSGPVDLLADVTVTSDADNDGTGGAITFESTVDGAQALTLDAGGGAVDLQGAVGGTTKLASLTVDGGQVNLYTVATTGDIDIEGSMGIALNGATYASDNGDIILGGAGGVTISDSSDSTVSLQAGDDLTINTDITGSNGAHSLIFEADSPGLSSNDGNGTLTIASGVIITSNNGDITLIGAGFEIDTSSSINAGTGDIHVAPSRAVAMTISNAAMANLSDAEIGRFTTSGTIHIGTATTGPSGSGGAGSSISASGITVSEDLTISGSASLVLDSGGTTTLNNDVSTENGNITFADAVTLGADVTVDSDADDDGTGGAITFTSTVDGAQALTLDAGGGAVELEGAVGGTTKLASLTVTGGQIDLYTVATTGDIDIEGSMGIALNGATYASDDGDITLGGAGGVTISDSSDSTVSLQAGDDLTINTDIIGRNGAHSFIFEADSPGLSSNDGTGTLKIASGVTITSNNGDITLIGAEFDIDTSSSINAGTGDIHVAPSQAVAMTISTTANLSLAEIGRFTTSGTIHIGTATTGPSGSGGAGSLISANGITVSEDLTISGSASLVLDSSGTTTLSAKVSTDDGNITFDDAVTLSADVSTDDGDITFGDAVILGADVTVDSDADGDGTGGSITFTSTVDGSQMLTLNAATGNIYFGGDVGSADKLSAIAVGNAHDVTVATTMWVGSFTQTAGTGTTDLGLNTVNADTSVDITTVNIRGKIVVGQEARLTAQEDIISIVEVGSLTIEASNAYLFGTVDGVGGRAASDLVVIINRGPGTYTMNGFIILGTGLGTRTYVELSSLPLAPVTPTVGVFTSLIPMLRASVNDSISGPYIVTDSEASSPLLTPEHGAEEYYEDIPLLLKTHDDEMVEME